MLKKKKKPNIIRTKHNTKKMVHEISRRVHKAAYKRCAFPNQADAHHLPSLIYTMMARVPQSSSSSPSSSCSDIVVDRRTEAFTIWMKSLIFNGNGCTAFNSNGDMIFRIDNYNSKHNHEVFLMDAKGQVVASILKRVRIFPSFHRYQFIFHVW